VNSIFCPDDPITEKCAVQAHLYNEAGAGATDYTNALRDEFKSAVGVMHLAGTGKDIEHLPCLSYGTKQRILAPLSLLLFVEADRCAFGLSASAQDRSVKIKRHPNQTEALESCKHHLPAGLPKLDDALVINAGQGPADRRNVRQLSQPQKTKHHKIVPLIVHIPKPPITQQCTIIVRTMM